MQRRLNKLKKWISYIILLIAVPVVILVGNIVFQGKQYAFISLAVIILSLIPFIMSFEHNDHTTIKLVIIAVMISISVVSRIVFSMIPGFKPVTALVIITAMYFGGECGFITGALTALISNFFFSQGIWTPFQMFTWGIIGSIAGIISKYLKSNKVLLIIYGVISAMVFSLIMDLWNVLWQDEFFNLSRYFALIISSSFFTVIYAISNVIFLFLLSKPIGSKIERIQNKYGIK